MSIYFIRRRTLKIAMCAFLAFAILMTVSYLGLKKKDYEPTLAPIYQGCEERKEIALTVNVYWGEEYLPQMLKIFKDNNIKATFFIGGIWAEKFPDLLREIHSKGHVIGSHGYSHPHPDQLSVSGNLKEIQKSEKIITGIIGEKINLFAPPYGERGKAVISAVEEAEYQFILWSVDTVDWQRPAPETIIQRVVSKAHNGAIVLMHPTAPTVRALPQVIKELEQRGYTFVTINQLIDNLPDKPINSCPKERQQ